MGSRAHAYRRVARVADVRALATDLTDGAPWEEARRDAGPWRVVWLRARAPTAVWKLRAAARAVSVSAGDSSLGVRGGRRARAVRPAHVPRPAGSAACARVRDSQR